MNYGFNQETYLAHHGVKGMKWGVRHDRKGAGDRRSRSNRAIQKDIDSLKPYSKTGIKNKKGKTIVSSKDVSNSIKGLETVQSKQSAPRKKMTHEQKVELGKKVAIGLAATATVAAAAYYVHKNPEAIGRVIGKVKDVDVKGLSTKAANAGKQFVKKSIQDSIKGVKTGVQEGFRDAPKKAAKAITTGIILNSAKRNLDRAVGPEEAARIFQANDNKKISKFWKVSLDERDYYY